ncbi:AAA family ATPase [Shewanella sp. 10N.286.54.B9]|uniref:AAA family ATPase n=1 Tax=Shewanella sp. 10N.286.54.B9 TaxID=3229719 RepID=UPI00354C3636
MSFTGSTLLPSQEALLNRLQHISLYGQQLIVLTGEEGAGKTTLVTALLTELEEFSSALVICPKYCDSAEIRRKILVQLLADPVFDDELPLPETMLRAAAALPSASCIVLDDAHYIPLEIWAECIVLSQMSFAGKTVNITMTCPVEFLNDVLQQLPVDQRQLLLPLDIDPIDSVEREGLYYTLLNRSEAQPFTPRDIVRNRLELQRGTPKEVVLLLELALNGDAEEALPSSKFKRPLMVAAITFVVLFLVWFFRESEQESEPVTEVVFAGAPVLTSPFLADYGEQLLAEHFIVLEKNRLIEDKVGSDKIFVSELESEQADKLHHSDVLAVEPLADSEEVMAEIVEPAASQTIETFSIKEIEAPTPSNQQKDITASINVQQKPTHGYTLQLASVKRLDSLARTLDKIAQQDGVKVARYRSRWVVLLGEFVTLSEAREQSLKLTANGNISAPWIRKWQDLTEYELQDSVPTREIN